MQFEVEFNSHSMYCTSITHYMVGNMTVKLPAFDNISATVFCATKQPPIQL